MATENRIAQFKSFPLGPNMYEVWYDFDNEQGIDPFTGTALNSGTGAVTLDRQGGWYRLSGAATTDDSGFQIQGDMETVSFSANKRADFITKVRPSDATQSEIFAGFAITDTTILDGGGTFAVADITISDGVFFYKPDGQTTVYGAIIRDSVIVASTGPHNCFADATDVVLAFKVAMDPSVAGKGTVTFYVDGLEIGKANTSTMPYDSEEILAPSIAWVTGDASGTKTLDVDYIGIAVER